MGSYYLRCSVSGVAITYDDPVHLIIIKPHDHGRVHGSYSGGYHPLTLPVKAKYDDYGRFHEIEADKTVERLEAYFGLSIKEIIDHLCWWPNAPESMKGLRLMVVLSAVYETYSDHVSDHLHLVKEGMERAARKLKRDGTIDFYMDRVNILSPDLQEDPELYIYNLLEDYDFLFEGLREFMNFDNVFSNTGGQYKDHENMGQEEHDECLIIKAQAIFKAIQVREAKRAEWELEFED